MRVKTTAIDRDGVKVIINASDFVAGEHKPWGGDAPSVQSSSVVADSDDGPLLHIEDGEDYKDALIAALAGLGIKKDRRTSTENLIKEYKEATQ